MRRAVVLPGRAYPASAPLLALAVDCLERHDDGVTLREATVRDVAVAIEAFLGRLA